MNYEVTIGIPVYKSFDYIQRSLESALNQTYASIEFLIIDDCGNDGSIDIIRHYQQLHSRGNHIHIISHQINQGVAMSRNDIIDKALGTYLFFMDSDDIIAERTISLMMHNVCEYDAEIVFGSYEKIETSGKKFEYSYPNMLLLEKDALACFAYRKYAGIQASSCNYLVKTSILRENHFRFINTNYWEDLVFTFDLVTLISRAVLLSEITYSYLCREDSLSQYQHRDKISKDEIIKNVQSINHLKITSSVLYNKVYYPNRCYNIVITDFYIACSILKRRKDIVPYISNKEIKKIMSHPASFYQICHFKQRRKSNILLLSLSKLPPSICVAFIWCIGKMKQLI